MSRLGLAVRAACCALVASSLAAIVLQEWTLPLGLFNEGREGYRLASLVCAAGLLGGLAVFGVELWRRRPSRLAGALRGALAAFVLLEALLVALDVSLVSRGAARLGGPYRELPAPGGGWVVLKKPHAGSPLGFRTAEPYPLREPGALRVLFLGDSYVEGSGRAAACNFPEVTAATLAEQWGRPVVAMNAGVAGAGPWDALRLFRLLVAEGYTFDAVVYALFLENDFTDNLPGSERRAVVGMNFRFPSSPLLHRLHPLNTTSARTLLFLWRAGRLLRDPSPSARRDAGECRLTPEPRDDFPAELLALAQRRLEDNYGVAPRTAEAHVAKALKALRAEVEARGAPFVSVMFPDRILADAALLERLGASPSPRDLDRLRRFARERLPGELVDLLPALDAGAENYRADDTHLSDLGNVRAGRYAGERLAERLRGALGVASPQPAR